MVDLNCLIEFVAWNVMVFIGVIMGIIMLWVFIESIADWFSWP